MKARATRQMELPIWSLAVLALIVSIVAGVLAYGMVSARREARNAHTEVELHRVQSEESLKLLKECLTPSGTGLPDQLPEKHQCYEDGLQRTANAVNTVNTKQREMINELVCYIAQTHNTLPLDGIQCTRKESG